MRFDGEHPDALPIVLTHGWPSSFLEMTALAGRLAAPSRHGGDPVDAFTVIVPSLPGFGLSPQRPRSDGAPETAELRHRLMHDELGFERYVAHGGDLGAGVTSRLGESHPEAVIGIHLLAVADPVDQHDRDLLRASYEHAAGLTTRVGRVDVPTAVAVFPRDLVLPPRSWAERTYDVTRYTRMPRGGHFAAHGQPERLGDDLTEFFRGLR